MAKTTASGKTGNMILAGRLPPEATHSGEHEIESTAEAHTSALSPERFRGKPMVVDHPTRPSPESLERRRACDPCVTREQRPRT